VLAPSSTPRSLNYPQMPIYQFLRSSAAKCPFGIAMIFDALEITYSELLTLSERFAAALQAWESKRGTRVPFISQLPPVCRRPIMPF